MSHYQLRHYLTFLLIIVFAVVLVGYIYIQAHDFIVGPMIVVNVPHNGTTVSDPLVVIEGEARNVTTITLNGRSIVTNEEGIFSEQLLLAYGYNIITIEAHDRFNRATQETLELVRN